MDLKYSGGFNPLIAKMIRARQEMGTRANQWASDCAQEMQANAIAHLETQGRGGEPPPLSPVTVANYNRSGWPDGSGIRDHIAIVKRGRAISAAIPEGEHATIARVQDRGAAIPSNGGFILIPARRFWRKSWAKTKVSAKQKLKRVGEVWK